MLKKKLIILGIIIFTVLAVSILLQKGILNLGNKEKNEESDSTTGVGARRIVPLYPNR